jgi:hypothetical protein
MRESTHLAVTRGLLTVYIEGSDSSGAINPARMIHFAGTALTRAQIPLEIENSPRPLCFFRVAEPCEIQKQ